MFESTNSSAAHLTGNCDIDVDECSSFPCQNGAACSHSDNFDSTLVDHHEYRCTCEPGFANGYCDYDFIVEYSSACAVMSGGNCDVDVDE